MWPIFAWGDRDEIPDWSAKHANCWGELCIPVRCVSVLEHCTLECVSVEITVGGSIVSNKALDSLYTNLGPRVAMGVDY